MSGKRKILFVDDEVLSLMNMKILFKREFEVFTALSAEEALDTLSVNRDIGYIFSDQKMNDISGLELLGIVSEKFPDTRRYIITGYLEDEVLLAAQADGLVLKVLHKPVQKSAILEVVN